MTEKIKVQIIKDGPIKVADFESIKHGDKETEAKGEAYLCRCGESSNPPFCDGTHSKINFSGSNQLEEQREIRVWEGKTIQTFFNSNLCMHAKYCKPLKDLRKKELDGDASAAEEIAKVTATCPSGALTYQMKEGKNEVPFESTGTIDVVEGGEVRIQASFEGEGVALQEKQPENRLTLCRCGLSKNKPFCDSSHTKKENFR